MNAYRAYDREEYRREDAEALKVLDEEEEAELADQFDNELPLSKLEAMLSSALSADKKAVSQAFMNDVDFQEKAAEFLRYAAETIATNQAKINRSLQ
ncbi:gam [Buttiauxella sp. 3AFRM03]|uniref:host-nuclease inhibitor Gam family protein n=1 Tax=Buttiauxella sp. 3AFRM03 TaxID=2479367 RepID=UPI000EF7A7E4|nr:host-nuclease inhibitor Gam family protein [Buttiauxella sp. 3AFRM03]AYN25730.1 gam [Buttiauxella sp. 3AFRM03]AYN30222.1 gam [Buttiauxella sp. 3AFRM03]